MKAPKTDLRDWIAAASGRVYSVATVEAGHELDWRRRSEVRRMVLAGRLPEDRPSLLWATAYARDHDRMQDVGLDLSTVLMVTLVALLALSDAEVLGGVLAVVALIGLVISSIVQRRRLGRLPGVVLSGYAQLSDRERARFDVAVRWPVAITARELAVGWVSALVAYALATAVGVSVSAAFNDERLGLGVLVSVSVGWGAIVLASRTLIDRRSRLRELTDEPKVANDPALTPPASPGGLAS